jgi:hypothetical protein
MTQCTPCLETGDAAWLSIDMAIENGTLSDFQNEESGIFSNQFNCDNGDIINRALRKGESNVNWS